MTKSNNYKTTLIAQAMQRYQDEKKRLFEMLDYDNISRTEYDKRVKQAWQDYLNFKKDIK